MIAEQPVPTTTATTKIDQSCNDVDAGHDRQRRASSASGGDEPGTTVTTLGFGVSRQQRHHSRVPAMKDEPSLVGLATREPTLRLVDDDHGEDGRDENTSHPTSPAAVQQETGTSPGDASSGLMGVNNATFGPNTSSLTEAASLFHDYAGTTTAAGAAGSDPHCSLRRSLHHGHPLGFDTDLSSHTTPAANSPARQDVRFVSATPTEGSLFDVRREAGVGHDGKNDRDASEKPAGIIEAAAPRKGQDPSKTFPASPVAREVGGEGPVNAGGAASAPKSSSARPEPLHLGSARPEPLHLGSLVTVATGPAPHPPTAGSGGGSMQLMGSMGDPDDSLTPTAYTLGGVSAGSLRTPLPANGVLPRGSFVTPPQPQQQQQLHHHPVRGSSLQPGLAQEPQQQLQSPAAAAVGKRVVNQPQPQMPATAAPSSTTSSSVHQAAAAAAAAAAAGAGGPPPLLSATTMGPSYSTSSTPVGGCPVDNNNNSNNSATINSNNNAMTSTLPAAAAAVVPAPAQFTPPRGPGQVRVAAGGFNSARLKGNHRLPAPAIMGIAPAATAAAGGGGGTSWATMNRSSSRAAAAATDAERGTPQFNDSICHYPLLSPAGTPPLAGASRPSRLSAVGGNPMDSEMDLPASVPLPAMRSGGVHPLSQDDVFNPAAGGPAGGAPPIGSPALPHAAGNSNGGWPIGGPAYATHHHQHSQQQPHHHQQQHQPHSLASAQHYQQHHQHWANANGSVQSSPMMAMPAMLPPPQQPLPQYYRPTSARATTPIRDLPPAHEAVASNRVHGGCSRMSAIDPQSPPTLVGQAAVSAYASPKFYTDGGHAAHPSMHESVHLAQPACYSSPHQPGSPSDRHHHHHHQQQAGGAPRSVIVGGSVRGSLGASAAAAAAAVHVRAVTNAHASPDHEREVRLLFRRVGTYHRALTDLAVSIRAVGTNVAVMPTSGGGAGPRSMWSPQHQQQQQLSVFGSPPGSACLLSSATPADPVAARSPHAALVAAHGDIPPSSFREFRRTAPPQHAPSGPSSPTSLTAGHQGHHHRYGGSDANATPKLPPAAAAVAPGGMGGGVANVSLVAYDQAAMAESPIARPADPASAGLADLSTAEDVDSASAALAVTLQHKSTDDAHQRTIAARAARRSSPAAAAADGAALRTASDSFEVTPTSSHLCSPELDHVHQRGHPHFNAMIGDDDAGSVASSSAVAKLPSTVKVRWWLREFQRSPVAGSANAAANRAGAPAVVTAEAIPPSVRAVLSPVRTAVAAVRTSALIGRAVGAAALGGEDDRLGRRTRQLIVAAGAACASHMTEVGTVALAWINSA